MTAVSLQCFNNVSVMPLNRNITIQNKTEDMDRLVDVHYILTV